MPSRSILAKLHTLAGVGLRRQALVVEAVAGMLIARIDVAVRPFSIVSKRFGTFVAPTDPRATGRAAATVEQAQIARDVAWAIAAAAPFMPFRAVCLQQAIAARGMLRRRGVRSVMHFGARRGEGRPIDGHAWVDAAGIRITGYPVAANLAELGCFV